jgi:hypothetical protein
MAGSKLQTQKLPWHTWSKTSHILNACTGYGTYPSIIICTHSKYYTSDVTHPLGEGRSLGKWVSLP